MRKFLSAALALLTLAFACPALPAAAADRPETASKVLTLLASAARTVTATGSGVSTGIATLPVGGITFGVSRHAQVFLNVTAAATGTLDLTVEGSVDGGTTYFTLTAASAWTQVTTSVSKQVRRYEGPIPPLIRAVGTIAASGVYTYSVLALCGG